MELLENENINSLIFRHFTDDNTEILLIREVNQITGKPIIEAKVYFSEEQKLVTLAMPFGDDDTPLKKAISSRDAAFIIDGKHKAIEAYTTAKEALVDTD